MKKVLSLALAVVMLFAVCVPAFAAADPTKLNQMPEQSGDVLVKTSTTTETGEDAAAFVVTIPADTTLYWKQPSADVGYSVESHLTRNKAVSVTVATDGTMKTADGAYTLAYTLEGADVYVADHPVVYPAAPQALTLLVSEDAWNYAVVEEYVGTLTYTAAVVDL